uniref:Uncharacterized protein n=1 Tax=Arundo donax TaxID=35708 RepID=A0A0A8YTC5_ARUDO
MKRGKKRLVQLISTLSIHGPHVALLLCLISSALLSLSLARSLDFIVCQGTRPAWSAGRKGGQLGVLAHG